MNWTLKATGARPTTVPHWPATITDLAASMRAGEDVAFALSDALLEVGRHDLAELLMNGQTKHVAKIILDRVKLEWTTRDGQTLLVCEMDDLHLLNSLRMVGRNRAGRRSANYRALRREAMARGLAT